MEVTPAVERESSRSQESSSSVSTKQVGGALVHEEKSEFSSEEKVASRAVTATSSVVEESSMTSSSTTVVQQSSKVVSSSSSLQIEETSEEGIGNGAAAAAAEGLETQIICQPLPTPMDQEPEPPAPSTPPPAIHESYSSNKEIEQEHIKSALQEIISEIEEAVVCAEEKEAAAAAAAAVASASIPGQPWQVHRPEATVTVIDRQTSTTTLATEGGSSSPVEAPAAITPHLLNGGAEVKLPQIPSMPQLPPLMTENQHDGMPAAKPLDLEKIFTPAQDSGEITPRNRRMYASSSFYAPNHPTVEDQVELARRISHSLSDSSNRQSKGQSMYVSRKKRSVQWVHGDQAGTEESEETITNGSAAAHHPLKLVMDPRGQVQDLTSLRRQGINVETPLSPDLCFDLVRDLNSPTGKGAELFAKRRRKAEKWVVDESNVRVSVNSTNEPQTPIVAPQTPGAAPLSAGTPHLVPSYLDPGRAQHQARLIEIQQRFTQPRLRMVKSPWDAALETGSVDGAFQELPKPRGFVMAPVPEAIDSWQEMHPAPSPLPPPPPVVTPAATSRTFTEPAPFTGVYGAKAPKGWPPAPGSGKVPTPVSGPIVKAALNTNPPQTKDTNITTAGSNIFEGSNCEAADFETICTQDTSALDESESASFSQLEQIDINTTNSLTQSSTTTKQISTSEFSSTSASSAPAANATAVVEEKIQTSSSELSHDIQTEAGVSYESQSFEKLMERFEMSGRPQLKYKQTNGSTSSASSTVIGTATHSSISAPVPEPKAAPVTIPAIPPQYYVAEASVQVRTFDQPMPVSESVTMQQQEMFSSTSSSLIEQKSSTRKEFVEEKKMFSSKQSLQQNFSSQQQMMSGSSLSQKSILQQQQLDASRRQEPLLLQTCVLPQVSAEEPPPPPLSSSSLSYSPRTSVSWTNYNTAPRGWSQNLHYYRPVTFNV